MTYSAFPLWALLIVGLVLPGEVSHDFGIRRGAPLAVPAPMPGP